MKIRKVYSKRLKRDVWSIDLTISGHHVRRSGYATRKEAENAISAMQLRQRAYQSGLVVPEPEITLQQLLEARQRDPTLQTRNKRVYLEWFARFVAATGPGLSVRSLGSAHLRAFRDSISHYSPNTITVRMVGMATALNAAGQYFPELEDYRAPRLRGLKLTRRAVLVPREEFQLVLTSLRTGRNANYHGADVLELLALTGARVGEILSIQVSDIDWERELLTLHATKTNNKRQAPITSRMAVILRRWNPRETPTYGSLLRRMRTAQTDNGISTDRTHWRIHDVRHTAASLMAEAGVSHAIIAALLGHTLGGATAGYIHATIPALRQAALILERWCADSPTPMLRVV